MKIQTTTLMLMAGLLALMNLPARAQEKPAEAPAPASKPETPLSDKPQPDRPRGDMNPVREPDRVVEKPVAYLGVLTGPVSRELRAQFGLADGFGLQVAEVMPDSPAKSAGLKEHDVLVKFEDQKLVNMEQLQTLVRSKKKDDTVDLTVITGGSEKQLSVKIGERMVREESERSRGGFMPFFGGGGPSFGAPDEWREKAEQFQKRVREYQGQMQEWNRSGRHGQVPPPPMFEPPHRDGERRDERGPNDRRDGPPRHEEGRRPDSPRDMPRGESRSVEHYSRHESASITRSDDSGIYSLRKDGDRTIFSVKPKEGEEKTWPVNTEAERAEVPETYREKLHEMEELRNSVRRDEAGQRPPSEPSRGGPPQEKRPGGI